MMGIIRILRSLLPIAALCLLATLWLFTRDQGRMVLVRSFGGRFIAGGSGDGAVFLLLRKSDFDGVVSVDGELRWIGILSMSGGLQGWCDLLADCASTKAERGGLLLALGPKSPGAFPGLDSYAAARLPFWFVLTLAGIAALLPLRRALIRFRRKRKGLCPQCGYDLRMTPGRCPECGAEASTRRGRERALTVGGSQ